MLPKRQSVNLHKKNLEVIKAVLKAYPIARIVAAWGDAIETRRYLARNLYDIVDVIPAGTDYEFYCLGELTKAGNPRHPLYLRKDSEYEWFPAMDYAVNLMSMRDLEKKWMRKYSEK